MGGRDLLPHFGVGVQAPSLGGDLEQPDTFAFNALGSHLEEVHLSEKEKQYAKYYFFKCQDVQHTISA